MTEDNKTNKDDNYHLPTATLLKKSILSTKQIQILTMQHSRTHHKQTNENSISLSSLIKKLFLFYFTYTFSNIYFHFR